LIELDQVTYSQLTWKSKKENKRKNLHARQSFSEILTASSGGFELTVVSFCLFCKISVSGIWARVC
jgi:hypothetical protein